MNGNSVRKKIKSIPLISSLVRKIRTREKRSRMLRFYRQFIHPGDLCFDIGANVGDWSEIFLSIGAKVIAVEPQSNCVDSLRQRFDKNSACTILPKAVGEKEEVKVLKVAGNLINSTFSDAFIENYKHYEYARWPSVERVQVTTLDNLITQFGLPVFCKIDAEGYELEIFKGLSQPIRFIQFEYVPPFRSQAIQCIDLLAHLGPARFNYYPYEEMKLELPQWATVDEMKTILHSLPEDLLVCDILVEFAAV